MAVPIFSKMRALAFRDVTQAPKNILLLLLSKTAELIS